jgi:small-conductance mechanosensitive channel
MTDFASFTLPAAITDNPGIVTLALVAGGVAVSLLVEWLARTLDDGRYGWQRRLRAKLGIAEGKRIPELKWLTLSYQFVLWPFIGYALLHVWGEHDLGESVSEALTGAGFKVGSVNIVPAHLVMGVLWFVLLLTLGRWFKKKLLQDWLPLANLESSVRVSIATLFGYVAFVAAFMVGLSVAGLDVSKLAIVAGALSVGIGFGLQNIFNNFVSGLILLFERPVRLGDYIKVAGAEGFVRRIRIRSTELETWDRTSIIVPNSELLSKVVENTSYHDNTGRLILPVQTTYDANPEIVKALLLEAAAGEEALLKEGESYGLSGPFVFLHEFEGSGLRFELRGYVRDMHSKAGAASRLRFRILTLMRERGIAMVSPRQDIHITNWPAAPEQPPATPPTPPPSATDMR